MRTRSLWRWLFEDRHTGRINIAEWPNLPLWVWIAARALGWVLHAGAVEQVVSLVGSAALVLWAVLEIRSGVNPWRRLLGLVVLVWTGASVLT
jgi:hypothetical protein